MLQSLSDLTIFGGTDLSLCTRTIMFYVQASEWEKYVSLQALN